MVPIWRGTTPGQHSKPRCGSSAASVLPSIHNTLRDPSAGSHKRTSSSSSAIESTKGVKRSRREPDNNIENLVDIYGDHQIAKQEREDGHPQCPFSRCDADWTRVEDRDRHIKSTCHFNTLRARCPELHCLFKGARPDIVLKHRHAHGLDESGKCTCGDVPGMGTWSYRCTLSDSVELQQIRLLINTFIQNLALIQSMRAIWNDN